MLDNAHLLQPNDHGGPINRSRGRSPALDDNSASFYSKPLDSHRHEIRLLQLYRPQVPSHTAPFKCRLENYELWRESLYSDSEKSKFVALSYCWGEDTDEVDLTVDSRTIRISSNLKAALHQLWTIGEHRIWVDFICINQRDSLEKSSQVAMMDKIYTRANVVYAWLGPGDVDSDLAMTALGSEKRSAQLDLPEEPEITHDAVARLLSRPYFTRMWVIQEICMPDSVVFVCGTKKIPFGTWVTKLYTLGEPVPAQYAQHLFGPIRGFRALEQERNLGRSSADLVSWLIRTRRSQAKDPRDKLYALLSLASDGRKVIVAPNYEQSIMQVCRDVTARMIATGHRTDVLLLAHRIDERDGWPSWVPNWSRIQSEPPPWVNDCLMVERKRLVTPNRVDHRILTVHGMKIDEIVAVMSPTNRAYVPNSDHIRSRDVVEGLRKCLTFRSYQHSKLETAQAMVVALQQHDEEHNPLSTWMGLHAHQAIGTRPLIEHLRRFCGDPVAPIDNTETLRRVTENINRALTFMNRWKMVLVMGKTAGFQWAYRGVMTNDLIYKIHNCRINVVLRAFADGNHRYVGELYPLEGRIEAPHLKEESINIV